MAHGFQLGFEPPAAKFDEPGVHCPSFVASARTDEQRQFQTGT